MEEKLNVLIVDNELLSKKNFEKIIQSLGHRVIGTPSDAKSALKLIKDNRIDLIFIDININGSIDGIKVIKMLNTSQTPLIYFISSYSDKEIISEALETKAHNYLVKPITETDIFIASKLALRHKSNKNNYNIYLSSVLYYSQTKKELFHNEIIVKLTNIEKRIIDILIKNLNSNVTAEIFTEAVWKGKEIKPATIRSALFDLRQKLPSLNVETNFGRGYSLLSEH